MYGVGSSSDAISRDMNSLLYSSSFKHPSDSEFAKIKELISSDPYPSYDHHKNNHNHNQVQNQSHHQQQQNGNHGQNDISLIRYRSAPSSFFANLLNDNGCEDFLDLNPDPKEKFLTRNQQHWKPELENRDFLPYSSSTAMKQESKEAAIQKQDDPMYGGSSRPVTNLSTTVINGGDNNLGSSPFGGVMSSTTRWNSNLIRQSSSPIGFLRNHSAPNPSLK